MRPRSRQARHEQDRDRGTQHPGQGRHVILPYEAPIETPIVVVAGIVPLKIDPLKRFCVGSRKLR